MAGKGGVGSEGSSETSVEGNGMGVVEGNGGDVGAVGGLAELQDTLDLLVELVGWRTGLVLRRQWHPARLSLLVYLVWVTTSASSSAK